jgi:fluoride ion exporter CrcB/FEX
MKAILGGTTRNHLKEWFKNQKEPNHFLEMFILNVFTTIIFSFFSCLSIACTNIWFEIYFGIKEIGNC